MGNRENQAADDGNADKVAAETGSGEAVPERGEASREDLQLLLEDARSKADQHWEAMLRAKAELDNVRKRMVREVEGAQKYGIERLIQELLPIKDSMELGIAAAAQDGVDPASLREGIELTHRMLETALGKFEVRVVDPLGERFDPERHQALTMQPAANAEPGTVVNVVQKGYLLHDRLVRPALVIVAQAPGDAPGAA